MTDAQSAPPEPPMRKVYIDRLGRRYVKADELSADPIVRERLESATKLAKRLGLPSALRFVADG